MSNLDTALALARQGIHVFPCRGFGDDRKQPCRNVFWRSEATCDENRIRDWWRSFPDAVPAINAAKNGLLIIDCDRKRNDAMEWLAEYAGAHGDGLDYPYSLTPSGGRHIFFRNTEPPHGDSRGGLPPKEIADIDVKGAGYVIAPGAQFVDGGEYVPHGSILDAKPAPKWLLELLSGKTPVNGHHLEPERRPINAVVSTGNGDLAAYGTAALQGECERVSGAVEGERNNTLNTAAFNLGQLVPHVLARGDVEHALESAAQSVGLTIKEARATIRSGLRAGMARPRSPDEAPSVTIDLPAVNGARHVVEATDGTLADAETGEVIEESAYHGGLLQRLDQIDPRMEWTYPAGLLGDITTWIMNSSRRPNRPLAVAAAISTLSAVCGRHLYGPSGCALNTYIVCIAKTGVGKSRPFGAVAELLNAADLGKLHTSGKFFSVSAIETLLQEQPCCVASVDEIGGNLFGRMCHARASTHEVALRGALLELWSREQGMPPFNTHSRANCKSTPINSPSFSLFGASTPESFYDSINSSSIKDGFLNRFLIIEASRREKSRDVSHDARNVPHEIVSKLLEIVPEMPGSCGQYIDVYSPAANPEGKRILWATDGIARRANEFEEDILTIQDSEATGVALLSRVFEYAVRLAALHAISRGSSHVGDYDWQWGVSLSIQSAKSLISGSELIADSDYEKKLNMVRNEIKLARLISQSDLLRRIRSISARDRDDIIKTLKESHLIREVKILTMTKGAKGFEWVG